MPWSIRAISVAFAIGMLALAVGFVSRMSWATTLWPWLDGRLSYIFIGSMCAAVGAGFVMFLLIDEPAAGQAIVIDALIVNLTMAVALAIIDQRDNVTLIAPVMFFAGGAMMFALMGIWASRQSFVDTVPIPGLIRWSFLAFVVILLFASTGLILKADTIFPWPLNPDSSVLFGCMFLGSAALFVPAIVQPYRNNVRLQLSAFLAYDLVLIVPFLRHFGAVKDDHLPSLIVYLTVILYSGALAIYGLVFDPNVRVTDLLARSSREESFRSA